MTIQWDKTLLVGDVGGTNARFALAHMAPDSKGGAKPTLEHHDSFPAETYPTFLEGVKAFIDGCDVKPTGGVIAVAGPVTDGEIGDHQVRAEGTAGTGELPGVGHCRAVRQHRVQRQLGGVRAQHLEVPLGGEPVGLARLRDEVEHHQLAGR